MPHGLGRQYNCHHNAGNMVREMGKLMRQRILHVIPSLERAGTEKQMSLLAEGLPREQFDVHVCALGSGGPLEAELRGRASR